MSSDFRQFDDHGLPLPQKFVDMRAPDEELPRKPKFSQRSKRIFLLVLVIGVVVPIVFGPQIVSTVRKTLGNWLQSRAERKLTEGDYRGALIDLNQAIGWNSESWDLYADRASVHEQLNELDESLVDLTKAIDLLREAGSKGGRRRFRDASRQLLGECYARRSWVNVRLERRKEAIQDASDAIEFNVMPGTLPSHLNTRAYARAALKMELKEGLADIDKAIALFDQFVLSRPFTGVVFRENAKADFLDTRGYLLHLLDRNEEALQDLDRAITMTEQFQQQLESRRDLESRREVQARIQSLRNALAVMYHHRGLTYEKLDKREAANEDLQRGEQLGYNPANGVF